MKKPVGGHKKSSDPTPSVPESSVEAGGTESASVSLENLGDLPRSYGAETIFLVAQEPHWLFTYWDLDIARHPGGKTFLRVLRSDASPECEIEVPFETRNWYIPVHEAGAEYSVEIGYYRGTQWNVIAASIAVRTPRDSMSGSDQFDYATIPLHLSFHKLMDNIQTTMQEGETLIQALGRLQKDGKLLAVDSLNGLSITADERVVLEALLGSEFLTEIQEQALSSEELSSRITQRLGERLHSAGASEILSKGPWGPSESSLFRALGSLSGASSWTAAALSSWAAAALTSWAAAAQSSWAGAAGGAGSRWNAEVPSSWGAAALSSWMQAATSSWAGANLTSWSQAALSSWSQAAVTSWGHAETSSWGGSEAVASFAPREFFMHVNAEVIFYGGTHPEANVTIDGKPVALAPDGSFRFHFVFPDGNYEIPIVATSPDGLETRSATLRFERDTKHVGEVGQTAQPPLPAPLGANA
jgi:hypothetical protein